ncbi:MAG: alpha/beta fold hydrolase [Solirubrobacteraceae bacterium]
MRIQSSPSNAPIALPSPRPWNSVDGTTLAYERTGAGPLLILVGGTFNTRHSVSTLAPLLAPHSTVYAYDRRGRGDSSDTPPYAVEREVEDLHALIAAAGGSALVYGHSSGAALALEATARGLPITKLAVYEPPYMLDDDREEPPSDYATRIQAAVDAGRPDEAAEIFLQDFPPEVIEAIKQAPAWPGMVATAHTLPYDIAVVEADGSIPTDRLATIAVPTLAMDGAASPAWAGNAVAAVAEAVPGAQQVTLDGQDHAVADAAVAPVLIDFLG